MLTDTKPALGTSPSVPANWMAIIAYIFVALALMAVTLMYAFDRIVAANFNQSVEFETAGLILLILLFIYLLYFAEGCEVAATAILERDEDELGFDHELRLLREIRQHPNDFISGRQLIVVALVVLFAAFADAFSHGSPAPTAALASSKVNWLFTEGPERIYGSIFPILAALWLSQLYAKFVAARRPATFFRAGPAQFTMRLSLLLGRRIHIGTISSILEGLTLKGKADDKRAASRIRCYSSLATFRDGFGFESVTIQLIIDPDDGSVEFSQSIRVKSYAANGTLIRQEDKWDSPIVTGVDLLKVNSLHDVAVSEPEYSDDEKTVKWDMLLTNPLPVGEVFDYTVNYRVGAGGAKVGAGSLDYFYYETKKYPTAELLLSVRLKSRTAFVLGRAAVIADVSDDGAINALEGERFRKCIKGVEGGLDFRISYPLIGGTYKCQWEMLSKLKTFESAGA